jgi:signal transduction histidine kinase
MDAEEYNQNQENENIFRQIANSFPQILWSAQPDGTIDWHSQMYFDYTGLDPKTDWQSSDSPIHPDDMEITAKRWLESVRTGQPSEVEQRLKRKNDSKYYWYLSRWSPVRDSSGQIIRWAGTTTYIHDQKIANMNLEKERELRETFVSTLTHDLRTPLTAAKMSAQILMRKTDDPETSTRIASRIASNLDRIDHMIRDLLDANLIKAGEKIPLDIKECDIAHVIKLTLEELTTIHGSRFILHSVDSIVGKWSCDGVRRILENLCSNAIKYGAVESPVTVSLSQSPTKITLTVQNSGNPIALQDQNTLFEPFRRTSAAQKGLQKGWGLGLTLVRGLVEAHDGTVSVESNPGDGTLFKVELPLRK